MTTLTKELYTDLGYEEAKYLHAVTAGKSATEPNFNSLDGTHLNVYGAEKFADYLGRLLKSERELTDYRENEKIARWWKPIIEKYKKEKEKN